MKTTLTLFLSLVALAQAEVVPMVPSGGDLCAKPLPATADAAARPDHYAGRFCSGDGDSGFLRLIDESFYKYNTHRP